MSYYDHIGKEVSKIACSIYIYIYILCLCLLSLISFCINVETDWLIVCWMMYYACLLTTLLCVALLIEGINRSDAKEIYDYSTGLVDMVLFTIASMYFVAGSYEVKTVTVQGNVGL